MSDNRNVKVVYNSPFIPLLAVAFIVLKLTHVIDWEWWWVLCPLWAIPAGFVAAAAVMFIAFIVLTVVEWASKRVSARDRQRRQAVSGRYKGKGV